MKKLLKTISAIIIAVSVFLCIISNNYENIFAENYATNEKTIIIDAGHGGFDSGAIADDNTYEKDLNLKLAKKLKSVLTGYGYNIIMTRVEDKEVSFNNADSEISKREDMLARLNLMDKYPDAIFISIHQNKFSMESIKGFQVFYSSFENSKELADNIQGYVVENLQPDNHRIAKSDTRDVLLLKSAKIPSIIIECGFMSNAQELNNLKSEKYQNNLVFCIANGILNFYNK